MHYCTLFGYLPDFLTSKTICLDKKCTSRWKCRRARPSARPPAFLPSCSACVERLVFEVKDRGKILDETQYEEPTWVSGRRERLDEAAARANAEDDRTMEVCEAVRGAATLVALHWSDVVLKAGESESLADDERGLIEELHVVRERCSTYEEELGRVTEQIEHLKEDIDHENQCTKRALDEQRWLVPRVAAAVDGMSDGDAAPSRHRSSTCAFPHSRGVKADWSPTWEEQVYNYSASGLSVPPTKMTALSPVSWAGYHCDRRRY
eukprot:TRINITY_DN13867_c0_g1_i2.p1 TRINITY_DN13867_c0_g1~~TRINITY_DN13867_c0_g1_i2.p1  ORF type:complete len:264 (+),score=20.90 TRINITY_DN13867_c0_g1_i2:257-1048(+)